MSNSRYRTFVVTLEVLVASEEAHWHSATEALEHVDALFATQEGRMADGWWPMQILSAGWKNGAGL